MKKSNKWDFLKKGICLRKCTSGTLKESMILLTIILVTFIFLDEILLYMVNAIRH
jgi:hypothetical protein